MNIDLRPADFAVPGGRLTFTSGTPVQSADVTGASANTLFFTPYTSDQITVWNGTAWQRVTFTAAAATCAVPSTVATVFDVFGFITGGVLDIETLDWTTATGSINDATNAVPIVVGTTAAHGRSAGDKVWITGVVGNTNTNNPYLITTVGDTTHMTLELSAGNGAYSSGGTWYLLNQVRATEISLQDGRYCKTGDKTRLYLGTGMTGLTSGQSEDSQRMRLLANFYNRVPQDLFHQPSTSGTAALAQQFNYASAVYPWVMFVQPGPTTARDVAYFSGSTSNNGSAAGDNARTVLVPDGKASPAAGAGTSTYDALLATAGAFRIVSPGLSRFTGAGVHWVGVSQHEATTTASITIGTTTLQGVVQV